MRLYVHVLETRNSLTYDFNGRADAYVKLQIGKYIFRTRLVNIILKPIWNEEFVFQVEDLDDELSICVLDKDGFFDGEFTGEARIPVWRVFEADNQTLPPTWFKLHQRSNKSKIKDCGEILLIISLYGRPNNNPSAIHPLPSDFLKLSDSAHSSVEHKLAPTKPSKTGLDDLAEEKPSFQALAGRLVKRFLSKNDNSNAPTTKNMDSLDCSSTISDDARELDEGSSLDSTFEEALSILQSRDQQNELPDNLPGGVLINQAYKVKPNDLNSILFAPNSQFSREFIELQGITDLREGPWKWDNDGETLKRTLQYKKPATKLVKSVRATEEQTYLKASGKSFAIFNSVSVPDVPYGSSFQVELLYKVMRGPELSSGEETSLLVISWHLNFLQSVMLKGIIEGGTRAGLKESYDQFTDFLAKKVKAVDSREVDLDKELVLASVQMDQQSDWKLPVEYFWNFTVVTTIFMGLYFLCHIILAGPSTIQGLEFTAGLLVLQVERVLEMVSHFVQARLRRGSDNGIKAQGDGWLLTVALLEGSNLASVGATGLSDPYVVFTCDGKARTSSIKLQTKDPQWNEIFEFDAMEEPPSMLDVEVFDYDGPFDEATSLGHAEINFLKHNSAELADIWVPLEGKLAQASQSKLHLRIFLDNTKGAEIIKEYLARMEKEVGEKINLRSPHRNSMFQKLFGLPPEEFLINDFSCYLKRKMPLQGRLFLSARIIGFYANLFGHKTKFFFLWEDIEDIQVVPPSLASVGSPSLMITLHKGRGLDARHGAKTQDEEGRLKFHFQSFVSFNVASRTIMALWRTRNLTPEMKAQIADDQHCPDGKITPTEECGSFLGVEDANMSKAYSASLPVSINSLMEMFGGGYLDRKIMDKAGCLNYTTTPWEAVRPEVYERHISYKLNRHISNFGEEVTSTQQKSLMADGIGWVVDEVMTLHNVPFGDHFRVHLRYQIEDSATLLETCNCHVYVGIAWLKRTMFQERITKNIFEKLTQRVKHMFHLAEILSSK
ncbi:hypothetical protein AMTRI_Chr06g176730 [Amborella trichopoda]